MTQSEANQKVREYVQRLTPQARSHLLVELERLHLSGNDVKGTEAILAELRAEFRKGGRAHDRVKNPSRYFFQPLEPMLVNCLPERANAGQISRGSLAAIWDWIGQTLLPAMTREYEGKARQAIVASDSRGADRIAAEFQSKVVKCLKGVLATPDGIERTRGALATYSSSRESFCDLTKMRAVLQARDVLAQFHAALPRQIDSFEGKQLASVRGLLDALGTADPEAKPFALTMLAKRLDAPWQLIRLATTVARSKSVADIAATPYAICVSMVMDHLDEQRLKLCQFLKDNRMQPAKEILTEIDDTEYELRAHIDLTDSSPWGRRLDDLMTAVAADVETEVCKIPNTAHFHHVLGSRPRRRHDSGAAGLSYLALKGRDAVTGGVSYCRNLLGLARRA